MTHDAPARRIYTNRHQDVKYRKKAAFPVGDTL